jgi:hypothetical protein
MRCSILSIALAATAVATTSTVSKRDVVECIGKGQVAYQDALSTAEALVNSSPGTSWESGIPLRSGNAAAIYFNQGFGSTIDTDTFGNILFDILGQCWTQQGQAKNLPGAGYEQILVGNNVAGVVCVTANGASNLCVP